MPTYVTRPVVAPMPNLENLRKQAKLYLRWHRDGHHPVAAEIRNMLPRFRDLSDREVLQHSFRLVDAQELVARQAGFETWQALKAGVQQMTDKPATVTARPVLKAAEPELFVSGFDAAVEFFTAKLGFEVVFTYGEPAFYGQVRRDQARLNLRLVCAPVFVDDIRERGPPRGVAGRCREALSFTSLANRSFALDRCRCS